MKKSLIFTVLFAIGVAAALPAQDFSMSAGVGGLYSTQFDGGYSTTLGYVHYPVSGFGGFLFFDASYVEASAGVFFGKMSQETKLITHKEYISLTSVNIGVLGKYPIELGSFVLYPLLGVEYDVNIVAKDEDGAPVKDKHDKANALQFNALWFKGGIGADFSITDSIYIRGQALYGARLVNQYEKDIIDAGSTSLLMSWPTASAPSSRQDINLIKAAAWAFFPLHLA
jgi:hypothetical protein